MCESKSNQSASPYQRTQAFGGRDQKAVCRMHGRPQSRSVRTGRPGPRGGKDLVLTPAEVAAVKVPTLGVVGTLDGYLPDFQALKKLRPDVKIVVVDGATHGGDHAASRRPEFITAIRELVASNRTSSSR